MAITVKDVLVDTDFVAANLGNKTIRLLEVDEDTDAYGRGHIRGAIGVHWKTDLQDPIRRDFIGPEAFGALMDGLGIGNQTEVILYGGTKTWFAAYTDWYFSAYGHGPVRLVRGGRQQGERKKREMPPGSP